MTCLFAVHISDGVLSAPWWVGGFVIAGLALVVAGWRVRDKELPTIALMTAAFFLASSIHLRVGPSSVHLLLNGLLGMVLGLRAPLAIVIGLTLQALLLQHGGLTALGINAVVMTLPALLCRGLFMVGLPCRDRAGALLVALSITTWLIAMAASIALFLDNGLPFQSSQAGEVVWTGAVTTVCHPLTWVCALGAGLMAAVFEARRRRPPYFALGLFLGTLTVMLTTLLNTAVLVLGGTENWLGPAFLLAMLHTPIAMLEGFVVGCITAYLARVKPELLAVRSSDFSPA